MENRQVGIANSAVKEVPNQAPALTEKRKKSDNFGCKCTSKTYLSMTFLGNEIRKN
jgi:hypothetical protein